MSFPSRCLQTIAAQVSMSLFFMAHPNLSMTFGAGLPKADAGQTDSDDDLVCEEVLLEEFARK